MYIRNNSMRQAVCNQTAGRNSVSECYLAAVASDMPVQTDCSVAASGPIATVMLSFPTHSHSQFQFSLQACHIPDKIKPPHLMVSHNFHKTWFILLISFILLVVFIVTYPACFANTEKNIEEKRIIEFIQCSEHVSLRESR